MKTALPVLFTAAALSGLYAGAPGTAAADVVGIKSVPVSKVSLALEMPRSGAPDHIPAAEKVEGFFPSGPTADTVKRIKEHGGYQSSTVYGTEAEALGYGTAQDRPHTCFTQGWSHSDRLSFGRWIDAPPPKPGSKEWLALQKRLAERGIKPSFKPAAKPSAPPPKPNTVRAIRSERFVVGEKDTASLEIVDAWFDYEELGVRQQSRTSVPFSKVATGPNGLAIYAVRDEKQVTFIVTPPKAPEQEGPNPAALRNIANRLSAQMSSGGGSSSSECGYLRMTLQTGPGSGQMASVLATAFLPPAAEDAADLPSTKADPDEDEEHRAEEQRKRIVRTRPVIANLSISQLATEADPLVSVTFAWAGHDQQQRF
jgi:hypothetical protein